MAVAPGNGLRAKPNPISSKARNPRESGLGRATKIENHKPAKLKKTAKARTRTYVQSSMEIGIPEASAAAMAKGTVQPTTKYPMAGTPNSIPAASSAEVRRVVRWKSKVYRSRAVATTFPHVNAHQSESAMPSIPSSKK